jgi:sirohydrochlorin cobaltochelatase
LKTTFLLVGHGSREPQGNRDIEKFAHNWQAQHPSWRIKVCFIEFATVLLDEGFDRAAQNAQRVLVIPLILNAAGHVKMEIPEHLAEARRRHPAVEFNYGQHLGVSITLLTMLKRRLIKLMHQIAMPDPKNTGVIILGRGSSDKVANGEVAKLARWLWEETDHELIDIAFTGITYPRLETVISQQVQLGMKQIIIQPYYLFAGTLMTRIAQQFNYLQQHYPQIRLALGTYLGFEPEIYQLLDQQVEAMLAPKPSAMMECDGCDYRAFFQTHHQRHQH